MAEKHPGVGVGTVMVGAPIIGIVSKLLVELIDVRIQSGTSMLFDGPVNLDNLELVIQAAIVGLVLPPLLFGKRLFRWALRRKLGDESAKELLGEAEPKE